MLQHNYIANLHDTPTVLQTMGYENKNDYNDRYRHTAEEKAQLYAFKLGYEQKMKREYGSNWASILRKRGSKFHSFNKSIVSGTKILAQWN